MVSDGTCILPSVYLAFQLAEVLLNVSVVCELRKHDASNLICSLSWLFWLFSSFVFRANFVIISSTSVKNAFCAADLHVKPQLRTVTGVKVWHARSPESAQCALFCPLVPRLTLLDLWATLMYDCALGCGAHSYAGDLLCFDRDCTESVECCG